MDLTEPVRLKILEKCPHLANLPAGKALADPLPEPPVHGCDWEHLGLFDPLSTYKDHAGPRTWQSFALALGAEIMLECRREVRSKLGYTCSAGIASNKVGSHTATSRMSGADIGHSPKFLAKVCSGNRKPDGQVCPFTIMTGS